MRILAMAAVLTALATGAAAQPFGSRGDFGGYAASAMHGWQGGRPPGGGGWQGQPGWSGGHPPPGQGGPPPRPYPRPPVAGDPPPYPPVVGGPEFLPPSQYPPPQYPPAGYPPSSGPGQPPAPPPPGGSGPGWGGGGSSAQGGGCIGCSYNGDLSGLNPPPRPRPMAPHNVEINGQWYY